MNRFLLAALSLSWAPEASACTLQVAVQQTVVPAATLILPSIGSSRGSAITESPDRGRPAGIVHAYVDFYQSSGPPGSTRGPTTYTATGDHVTLCNLNGSRPESDGDWWCEVEPTASGTFSITFDIKSSYLIGGAEVEHCEAQDTFSYRYDAQAPVLRWVSDPGGKVLSSSDNVKVAAQDETALQSLSVMSDGTGLGEDINTQSIVPGPFSQNIFAYHSLAGPQSSTVTISLAGLSGAVTLTAKALDFGAMKLPGERAYDWQKTEDYRSFTVDRDPPKARILNLGSPAPDGRLATLSGTASDDVAVERVTIAVQDLLSRKWWDGSTFTASGSPIRQALPGTGPSVDWTYDGLASALPPTLGAAWMVTVEATDKVGRTGEAKGLITFLPTGKLRQRQGYVTNPPPRMRKDGRGTDPLTGDRRPLRISNCLPAGSPELALELSHSAQGPQDSVWGRGWTSPHDQTLLIKSGNAILWTDGDGTQRHYFPPASGNVYIAPPQSFTTLTVTERDGAGQPTRAELKEKDGTVTAFVLAGGTTTLRPQILTDRNGMNLTYTRDGNGLLTRVTDSHSRFLQLTYTDGKVSRVDDSAGRFATYAYDADGYKTSETAQNGTTGFVYDAQGRLTRMNYPNAGFRAVAYDAEGKVRSEESESAQETLSYEYFPSSTVVTDALDRKTVYEFTSFQGLRKATKVVDPAGKEVSFAYDANMNLIRQVDSRGASPRTTEYGYDAFGNVTSVVDPAAGNTDVAYDPAFNQPTSITDPNRNPATTLGYDPSNGDLTSVVATVGGRQLTTSMGYDGQGHVSAITDPRGKTTSFEYDNNGQLTKVSDPVHPPTILTRDPAGRVTSQRDPKTGLLTTFAYDTDGSLRDVTDAINGITHYDYASGRESRLLSKVTDARQQALGSGLGTIFGYDTLGRLISVAAPDSPARTFLYNDDGTLKRAVNARGTASDLTYDAKGRLTSKTIAGEGVYQYGYDDADRQTLIVTPDGSRIERAFDALDRVVTSVQTYPDGYSATLSYDYDANGNKLHTLTPWGTFTYVYDHSS